MSRTNIVRKTTTFTHEGGPAVANLTPVQMLQRSVMSCLLWEDTFYEEGISVTDRILEYAAKVPPATLAAIAIEAREKGNLRHVPLLLLRSLVKHGRGNPEVSNTIARVIKRVDEMGELLSLYWQDKDSTHMVPAQLRKGLAKALVKFDEYQLAKYDRNDSIKLRDVLRVARAMPANKAQAALWGRAVKRTLATPDTWEVELSAGKDKGETFTRLLTEEKLGYLALLRNLRNMVNAGVNINLIKRAILARKGGAERVLPFRFVAAARAAPQLEPALDTALVASLNESEPLPGNTIVLVDVSGSMDDPLSKKSDLRRVDAAATLASIIQGNVRVATFSEKVVEVPPRKGMAGVDAILASQAHSGTRLGEAVAWANKQSLVDRLIVITDEQSTDRVPDPVAKHAYMINVASYQNGVGYRKWVHIDGFSENVIRYIRAYEAPSEVRADHWPKASVPIVPRNKIKPAEVKVPVRPPVRAKTKSKAEAKIRTKAKRKAKKGVSKK